MTKVFYGFIKAISKSNSLKSMAILSVRLMPPIKQLHLKYDLALCFICVKTNVGYSVVAEFVVQQTAENITESLTRLGNHNIFMTNYSEAELVVLEKVFPNMYNHIFV